MEGFTCVRADARCRAHQLVGAWLERHDGPVFAMGTPQGVHVGLGRRAELVVTATDDPTEARAWAQLDELVAAHRERGVVGYLGFGLNGHGVAPSGSRILEVFVPEHLLYVGPDQVVVRWGAVPPAGATRCGCAERVVTSARALDERSGHDRSYLEALAQVSSWTRAGDDRRLTICRRVVLPDAIDMAATALAARDLAPCSRSFHLRTAHVELAGTSPELLVDGTVRRFRTYKLSGTYPRAADPVRDAELRAAFLDDRKIAHEHASSRRSTLAVLAELGPSTATAPMCLDLPELRHMMTVVDTEVGVPRSVSRCLRAALSSGASPREQGLRFLAALEPEPRGPYYGLLGLALGGERIELTQILRAVIRDRDSTHTWVGAAVTADSSIEQEYEETRLKLGNIPLVLSSR